MSSIGEKAAEWQISGESLSFSCGGAIIAPPHSSTPTLWNRDIRWDGRRDIRRDPGGNCRWRPCRRAAAAAARAELQIDLVLFERDLRDRVVDARHGVGQVIVHDGGNFIGRHHQPGNAAERHVGEDDLPVAGYGYAADGASEAEDLKTEDNVLRSNRDTGVLHNIRRG